MLSAFSTTSSYPSSVTKPVDALTYQGDMVPFIPALQGRQREHRQGAIPVHGEQVLRLPELHLHFGIDNGFSKSPAENWKKPKVQPWDLKLTWTTPGRSWSTPNPT